MHAWHKLFKDEHNPDPKLKIIIKDDIPNLEIVGNHSYPRERLKSKEKYN